ncbi:hypothetical protein MES4922_160179 [Mesorhizobium ventifaucium]|uniref:Uncharacterized protein n=1 Tax=Mesorhizobium ventifaucium TaxID=666020 RepID=A0ABM9DJ24_9HYPH|nr:hypothetical protein MES4922_160179 [Mesorhizobium ventifaucium]
MFVADDQQTGRDDQAHGVRYTARTLRGAAPVTSLRWDRAGPGDRPLFLLTRSRAILDLAAVGTDEAIILCPANHSPPTYVAAYPGTPGYEAVATCLASPEVRARTDGVIAWPPQAASGLTTQQRLGSLPLRSKCREIEV